MPNLSVKSLKFCSKYRFIKYRSIKYRSHLKRGKYRQRDALRKDTMFRKVAMTDYYFHDLDLLQELQTTSSLSSSFLSTGSSTEHLTVSYQIVVKVNYCINFGPPNQLIRFLSGGYREHYLFFVFVFSGE